MHLNIHVWETMQCIANITHNIQTARNQSTCFILRINWNNPLYKVTNFRSFEASQITSQVSQLTWSLQFGSYYAVWRRMLHKFLANIQSVISSAASFRTQLYSLHYLHSVLLSLIHKYTYIHLHLEPKLRVTEAIPPLPLCTFMAYAGIIYSLHTDHISNVDIFVYGAVVRTGSILKFEHPTAGNLNNSLSKLQSFTYFCSISSFDSHFPYLLHLSQGLTESESWAMGLKCK